MTEDKIIGNESASGMPWNVPEEYQHYLDSIQGGTVIMGWTTYGIFGKDVKGVQPIVLSRSRKVNDVTCCVSLEEAIKKAQNDKIFVAGGGQIYTLALPKATKMMLSTIKGTYTGSVYFPSFSKSVWKLSKEDDRGSYIYREWIRNDSNS